jgi:glycosyltransferase involved in cell wall biosynthesis
LKIAVNLLPFREKIAGAGKYAQNIIYELSKQDSKNEYYLFISERGKINFNINAKNFYFVETKFNPESILSRIFWEQFIFPLKLKKLKPDLIFTPSVAIPIFYNGIFYTSIHDLAYKNVKKKYTFLRNIYVRFVTTVAAKKSNKIFALTEFTKKEIETEFNLKSEDVLVTYTGVAELFFKDYPAQLINDFAKKYSLPERFILYVGAIEPGKNLDKLFIAFAELAREENDIKLVLTSGIGWEQQGFTKLIDGLGIREKLILLPYINEPELPLLYKSASMLSYLSSYEGFGMPVLEAMAAGTPILSSKSKAINEFAGQAILTIDPDNIDETLNGMKTILSDEKYRNLLVEKGKLLAEKFKWSNSAEVILNEILSFKAS